MQSNKTKSQETAQRLLEAATPFAEIGLLSPPEGINQQATVIDFLKGCSVGNIRPSNPRVLSAYRKQLDDLNGLLEKLFENPDMEETLYQMRFRAAFGLDFSLMRMVGILQRLTEIEHRQPELEAAFKELNTTLKLADELGLFQPPAKASSRALS